MKISSDPNHPDYAEVVMFIDKIYVNDVQITNCTHVDTKAGLAECITVPFVEINGALQTYILSGKINITWRVPVQMDSKRLGSGARTLFEMLKKDWERREDRKTEGTPL